jgi:hypothetical protein
MHIDPAINKVMIVNKTNFYYLDDNHSDLRVASAYQQFPIFNAHNYYYIEFKWSLNNLDKCLNNDAVLNDLVHGDLYLAMCNSHEAFHSVVNEIYQIAVIGLSIPEHKILLLSESADIYTEVTHVASRLGKQEIKVVWTRIFEWSATCYIRNRATQKKILYDPKLTERPFSKSFLNFNRRWRLHRPTLVALLLANNILDKGHVSLAPIEGRNWENIWWSIESYHSEEIKSIISPHKNDICNLPPLYLDTTSLEINRAALTEDEEYLYHDSYFSVVSETNFYDDQPGRFLSEKIFKPVAMEHPFMVVSRPHTLDVFKELGYKSFSPYINESYDTIEDNSERLLAIVNEIKRLSLFSPTELSEFLINVKPICDYNFKILLTKKNFITHLN